jgi:hypothetical protein
VTGKCGTRPSIIAQPQSQGVLVGSDVILSVTAVGATPLRYQWQLGGANLDGATDALLTLGNVQRAAGGDYTVIITNPYGSVTSQAASLTFVNRPPVAVNTTAQIVRNQTLVISMGKLLSRCSDPDGDALAVVAGTSTSTNGGPVSVTAESITYTPVTDYVGADLLYYVITDGRGGMANGAVTVAISSGNAPALNIVSGPNILPNGHFHVGFAGIPGFTYSIHCSPSVNGPWTPIATLTAGDNGLFDFEDPTEPRPASRYYRTSYP